MSNSNPDSLQLITIVAHPHDVTYTLGTSAHHIERGDRVTVVSLTDGITTHDEELEDELRKAEHERRSVILERSDDVQSERKQDELKRVCGLFGITDVRVLPFTDNPIEPTPEIRGALADIFYELRPDIVITHAPYNYPYRDQHSLFDTDHCMAGQLAAGVMQSIGQADKRHARPPHRVAQVYYIGVEFGWTDIDLFVDISDQIANRIQAEALYKTQGHTSGFGRKRVEAFAGYHGWFGRTGYAEPFVRSRGETGRYLTVTPTDLEIARQTGRESIESLGRFESGK